jgi:predicted permease
VPLGLEPERVVTARFTLGRQRYARPSDQITFFNELQRRLVGVPGLDHAAIADSLPPSGATRARPFSTIAVAGRPPLPAGSGGMVPWRYVSHGYFHAMGIPVVRGRGFIEDDRSPEAYSVVISESLARRLFPGEDPLGRQILESPHPSGGEVWFSVVGVAGDVKNSGLDKAAAPEYYLSRKPAADLTFANAEPPTGWRGAYVVARTALDPEAVAAAIRETIQSIDPSLPVETGSMRTRLRGVTAASRFQSVLLGVFGAIAVLLTGIGCFAVTAYAVSQRRREIGIRMALGATESGIRWLSIRGVAAPVAAGIVLGTAGSLALAPPLRTLLFGVVPHDPLSLVAAAVVVTAAAGIASWIPARRASRIRVAELLSAGT